MSGIAGDELMAHGSEFYYAFPNRFLLPKGKMAGQVYQFYVMVSPYKALADYTTTKQHTKVQKKFTQGYQNEYYKYPVVGLGEQYLDAYPLGYPFDRPIDEYSFYVPNSYFKDVVIYHKQMGEINSSVYREEHYDETLDERSQNTKGY